MVAGSLVLYLLFFSCILCLKIQHSGIMHIINLILQRPDAVQIANIMQMVMWAPPSWRNVPPCNTAVRRWFLTLSAKIICHMAYQRSNTLELESSIQTLFLSRLHTQEIDASLAFLRNHYSI